MTKHRAPKPGDQAAAKETPVYSFETKPKCTRCHGTDTRCYATKGGVQYRECRLVVCRVRFTVQGKLVQKIAKGGSAAP